jgi:hypothetical protein
MQVVAAMALALVLLPVLVEVRFSPCVKRNSFAQHGWTTERCVILSASGHVVD